MPVSVGIPFIFYPFYRYNNTYVRVERNTL